AGMDVGVDEARRKELSLGVDDPIDLAFESFADVEDLVALEHEFPVADEGVMPALMAHDPRRLDFGAHAFSTRPSRLWLEPSRLPRAGPGDPSFFAKDVCKEDGLPVQARQ